MARTAKRYDPNRKKSEISGSGRKRYVVGMYARLSSDRDEGKRESIENQIVMMKAYAAEHPELEEYRVYADSGVSGTSFDRPEFNRLMDDVRIGRINCILVKDLSRFGRDYLEASNYIEVILPFLEVRLISVNDHFDTDEKNYGNKELEIMLKNLANDMYAKDISRKICSAKKQDVRRGKVIGGQAPYGYVINRKDELRRYLVDEPAAEIVRDIFRLASEGFSLLNIAKNLVERGVSIPGEYKKTGHLYYEEGDRKLNWRPSTICAMLHNEGYIGTLVQSKRKTRLYKNEAQRFLPKDEWVRVEHAHEAIVSEELFHKVEKVMGKKFVDMGFKQEEKACRGRKQDKYKGLFYCGKCGRKMLYRKGYGEGRHGYHYYCGNVLGHEDGKGIVLIEEKLDEAVSAEIRQRIAGLTDKDVTVASCEKAMKEELIGYEKDIAKVRGQCERVEEEDFHAYHWHLEGAIGEDEYFEIHNRCMEQTEKYRNRLSGLEDRMAAEQRDMERRIAMVKSLYRAKSRKKPDYELLHELIEKITICDDRTLEVRFL